MINDSIYDRKMWEKVKSGVIGYDSLTTPIGFNLISIRPNLEKWAAYSRMSKPEYKQQLLELNKIITGVMTSEFSYSLDSEWDTIQTPLSSIDIGLIGDFFVAAGGGELGAVYKSKKIWKKSGYLSITPKIRIIDVNGTGLPLRAVRQLLWFCTATVGANEDTYAEWRGKVTNFITGGIGSANNFIQETASDMDAKSPLKGAAETVANISEAVTGVSQAGVREYLDGIEDAFSLKVAPPPLIVDIGRVFHHEDMILTNVSFTFSQENTFAGPMYVDIDLALGTRKIINGVNDTGMRGTLDKGIVSVVGAGGTIATNNISPVPPINKEIRDAEFKATPTP